jgi:hypothetical protein
MTNQDSPTQASRATQRFKFFGIVLVCLAPVILSYAAYYFWKPEKRNNYGDLIEPQRPTHGLVLTGFDSKPFNIEMFRKRFVMVQVQNPECDETCAKQLYLSRQVHAMVGRDRERIERLLLIPTPSGQPPKALAEPLKGAHPDLTVAYADPASLNRLLPPAAGNALKDHIFLIDVQGNLMMRFNADPDPYKIKKDLMVLLKAASVR